MTDKWVTDPETGAGTLVPLTPEEEAQDAADRQRESSKQLATGQAAAEDGERLRTINERARTDPAFAALAEYVLRGVQR